jgi:hypothetical protein
MADLPNASAKFRPMLPKARIDAITAPDVALEPLAAEILRAADGTRTVKQIALAVSEHSHRSVSEESVWSILDALADAKLLVERVTPPAGVTEVSRRSVLRAWGAAAAVAAIAPIAAPRAAEATLADDKANEQQAKLSRLLSSETKFKNSLAAEEANKRQRLATALSLSKEEVSKVHTSDDKAKEAAQKKTFGAENLQSSMEEREKLANAKTSVLKAMEQQNKSERKALELEQQAEELSKTAAGVLDKGAEQKSKEARSKTLAQLATDENAKIQKSMEADQKKATEKSAEDSAKEQAMKSQFQQP